MVIRRGWLMIIKAKTGIDPRLLWESIIPFLIKIHSYFSECWLLIITMFCDITARYEVTCESESGIANHMLLLISITYSPNYLLSTRRNKVISVLPIFCIIHGSSPARINPCFNANHKNNIYMTNRVFLNKI